MLHVIHFNYPLCKHVFCLSVDLVGTMKFNLEASHSIFFREVDSEFSTGISGIFQS